MDKNVDIFLRTFVDSLIEDTQNKKENRPKRQKANTNNKKATYSKRKKFLYAKHQELYKNATKVTEFWHYRVS